jgi:predicted ABC-type transport system involved in lysophospholipase L1 biosynthesis ATPase subunit
MNISKSENSEFALSSQTLSKQVSSPEGLLTILDNVSLNIQHGESVEMGLDA